MSFMLMLLAAPILITLLSGMRFFLGGLGMAGLAGLLGSGGALGAVGTGLGAGLTGLAVADSVKRKQPLMGTISSLALANALGGGFTQGGGGGVLGGGGNGGGGIVTNDAPITKAPGIPPFNTNPMDFGGPINLGLGMGSNPLGGNFGIPR